MSARKSEIEVSEASSHYLFSERGFLKCSPDRKKLFAVCSDGLIYGFKDCSSPGLFDMTELNTSPLIMEKITAVSVSNENEVAVAMSDASVYVYRVNFDGNVPKSAELVTRCVGEVTALAISPSGKLLCCAGQDNNLKIINLQSAEYPILTQLPSAHFVTSIAFDETGSQFGIVDASGTIRIYSLVDSSPVPQLSKTLINSKCRRDGHFQVSFSPKFMTVLCGSERVVVYDRSNWSIRNEFISRSNDEVFTFEMVSDRLAILSQGKGGISLYSVARNEIIATTDFIQQGSAETSLCAINESFACVFDQNQGSMFEMTLSVEANDLERPLEQTLKKRKIIDDAAEDEDMEDEEEDEEIDEAEMDSDEEGASVRHDSEEELSDVDMFAEAESKRIVVAERKRHPIIQPGCTPWRNLQRYLAYNNVGFITARREVEGSVYNYDIEFMDRSTHKPVRFSEEIAYTAASLNDFGAIFGAQGNEVGVGACIHYLSFENSRNSWSIPLASDSQPILVGLSPQRVFVVTKRGILNVYSLSGLLQTSAVCPGRPISLTAAVEDDQIILFTEDSEGILCRRIDVGTGAATNGTAASRVLLTDEGDLNDCVNWCGVGLSGLVGVHTKMGHFLTLFTSGGSDRWCELLSTSGAQVAWPVYFDATCLSVVLCSGNDYYPDPYPTPHISEITFRMPEVAADPFSSIYEETLRTHLIVTEINGSSSSAMSERERKKLTTAADRHLLELAQLSIKSERLNRLGDLARLAGSEKTIDLMIQLAKHHKLLSAVDELEAIKLRPVQAAAPPTMAETPATVAHSPLAKAVEESPGSLLTNLTPLRTSKSLSSSSLSSLGGLVQVCGSSSPTAESSSPAALPANPFSKAECENVSSNTTSDRTSCADAPASNIMLDYISAMMKMNNGKDKKKSSLGSNVTIIDE